MVCEPETGQGMRVFEGSVRKRAGSGKNNVWDLWWLRVAKATTWCKVAPAADAERIRVRGMCAMLRTMVGCGVRALGAMLAAGGRVRPTRPGEAIVGDVLLTFDR